MWRPSYSFDSSPACRRVTPRSSRADPGVRTRIRAPSPITTSLAPCRTSPSLQFEDGETDLTTPKLLFIALNLASLGVALYKCKSMGLLPLTAADWTGLLPVLSDAEVAGVPL